MFYELNPFRQSNPYHLQFVNAGEMFKWVINGNFASTTSFQIKTPLAKDMHIISQSLFTPSSRTTMRFIEGAITANGAVAGVLSYGANRQANTTSQTKFYNSPTTGGISPVTIYSVALVKNTKWSQTAPEIILPRNSDYLLKFNSAGAGLGQTFTIQMIWYEAQN